MMQGLLPHCLHPGGLSGQCRFFYAGQALGYDQQEQTSAAMALGILLDIMVTLLVLIYGLVKFREPEHY